MKKKNYTEKEFPYGLKVVTERQRVSLDDTTGFLPQNRLYVYRLSYEALKELVDYLFEIMDTLWPGSIPVRAYSMGSDYCEYYDRELDNNGYLDIRSDSSKDASSLYIQIEPPTMDTDAIYRFSKARFSSFLYDLSEKLDNMKSEE